MRSKVREREWRRESPTAQTDLNENSENGETNAEIRPVGREAGREAGSVRGVRGARGAEKVACVATQLSQLAHRNNARSDSISRAVPLEPESHPGANCPSRVYILISSSRHGADDRSSSRIGGKVPTNELPH